MCIFAFGHVRPDSVTLISLYCYTYRLQFSNLQMSMQTLKQQIPSVKLSNLTLPSAGIQIITFKYRPLSLKSVSVYFHFYYRLLRISISFTIFQLGLIRPNGVSSNFHFTVKFTILQFSDLKFGHKRTSDTSVRVDTSCNNFRFFTREYNATVVYSSNLDDLSKQPQQSISLYMTASYIFSIFQLHKVGGYVQTASVFLKSFSS